MAKLAAGIGVHKTTLAAWVAGPQSRKKARVVRPVKVAVEPERVELVAVLPSGVRLEGLRLRDAIELVRALS